MESKEKLAEQYAEELNSAYTNDYYGFLAGFSAKEEQIKDKIQALEDSKGFKLGGLFNKINFNSQQERMQYTKKVDEVIEILKSLVDEE